MRKMLKNLLLAALPTLLLAGCVDEDEPVTG